jgi:23S rRNA (guanosine2251-2'-O)-methyltransferase
MQADALAPTRRRVSGLLEIERTLDSEALRCLVLPETGITDAAHALAERAADASIPVHRVARRRFERMQGDDREAEVLALVGPDPKGSLEDVMARGGVVWLLFGIAYPGNAGFAIRTAEVSGADGLYIDNDFDHAGRREATRASMRADRFMPVGWESANDVFAAARAAGKRIVGIEDVGTAPPWHIDLAGPLLLVVGAEAEGIPRALLDDCDAITRLPMAGFIASYNLQTAVASVAMERFRQLEESS